MMTTMAARLRASPAGEAAMRSRCGTTVYLARPASGVTPERSDTASAPTIRPYDENVQDPADSVSLA